eukprot:XP_019920238.1 PREDICTED: uncharacterized protein LOC105321794 [Crassostrea gigas]
MSYTPQKPGVFAMILEASDSANNSDYVSRYVVVYDPSSTIEIQTGDADIKALYGSKNASFKWQVLSSSSQSGLNLEFSWRGHFINRLHHEGGFLNTIESYSPQLQDSNTGDNKFPKTVNVKYNIVGENGLTGNLIPNELGITKFQTYLDETGQQKVEIYTGVSWVDQNIKTTASFPLAKTVSEGDFVTLWVKAEDKIGNVKLSSLPLGFDSSKQTIYEENFMQDMGTKYTYRSKLWFKTMDQHSGISQISFNIINKSNNTIAAKGSVPVNTSNMERGFPNERYRVRDTFYFYQHELEINNCWFSVPKSRQVTDRFEVEIIAYNGAMLQSRKTIDVNFNSFKGIGHYQAVKDVNLLRNTGNSVRFSFNLTESCYRRQKIILNYNDGQDHEKLINPSADKYDLLGLQPLTAYNVSVVVEYDEGDISDPFYYSFRTVGNQGFKDIMSRSRFRRLTEYLHLKDNTTQSPVGSPEYDWLHKIRPLIEMTQRNFQRYMKPGQCQSIDEGMIRYKGHYFAKQYTSCKPIKRVMKVWMRCEPNGYTNDYKIYLGKHDEMQGQYH